MHLPFDILKKERDGSFRWFESVNDLGSAQQPIQQPEPIPQPAPEPAPEPTPEPAPEPAPPAPQSDSNARDRRGPLLPESNSAARLWPTERRGHPAAVKAMVPIKNIWVLVVAKTYSENSGPNCPRHLCSSALQRLDVGTPRILANVLDCLIRIASLAKCFWEVGVAH